MRSWEKGDGACVRAKHRVKCLLKNPAPHRLKPVPPEDSQ